ncbi:MAG TPA: hypothetical protein VIM34_06060 [Burkholderiaceae bacterium]
MVPYLSVVGFAQADDAYAIVRFRLAQVSTALGLRVPSWPTIV